MIHRDARPWCDVVLKANDSGWSRCTAFCAGRELRFGVFSGTHSYRVPDPSVRAQELLLGGDLSPEQACREALASVGAVVDHPDLVSGLEFAVAEITSGIETVKLTWIGAPCVIGLSPAGASLLNAPHFLGNEKSVPEQLRQVVTRGILGASPDKAGRDVVDTKEVELQPHAWLLISNTTPLDIDAFAKGLPKLLAAPSLMATTAAQLLIPKVREEVAVVAVDLDAMRKYGRAAG